MPMTVTPAEVGVSGFRKRRGARRSDGLWAGVALFLAACSATPEEPGAVTADEARQLNEAAAMLDANSVDPNAVATNESTSQQ